MSINRKAWRFFHEHAGYVVGQRAIGAADLARAEEEASSAGWQYEWPWDEWSAGDGCHNWGCDRKGAHEHEVLGCVLKDSAGEVLESLWGIWDADRDYQRVVEAELASEALSDLRRQWGSTVHAR